MITAFLDQYINVDGLLEKKSRPRVNPGRLPGEGVVLFREHLIHKYYHGPPLPGTVINLLLSSAL